MMTLSPNPKLKNVICVDFETKEVFPDGTSVGSTEAYRENFRIDSAAFSWYEGDTIKSCFVQDEENVRRQLEIYQDAPLLVFNYQFEKLVSICRLPELNLNWFLDAQRLAQVYDNGGDKNAFEVIILEPEDASDPDEIPKIKKDPLSGLSLVRCMKRIMGEEDHKKEAHEWLRNNGIKKGQEGANLDKLPFDILERYNVGDTEATLRLANFLLNYFDSIGYDPMTDHKLYMESARRIAEAKKRGIRVDRDSLKNYIGQTTKEITAIGKDFIVAHTDPIKKVERQLRLERIRKLKTLKGRKKYLRKGAGNKDWPKLSFNPGSNRQLEILFCDVLGIEPFFRTPKNKASFKSSHLHQYGDGGKLLEKRRKRQIVLKQAEALYEKSAYDGRYHVDLKAVGTVTGRFAGSGGLNIQALARRDFGLMSCLMADDDHVFVSMDVASGEPTIITEYTSDYYYRYFCFDGVGKKPFYKDGVLMIDDIYLGHASVCPIFKKKMYDAFHFQTYNGKSFAEQWLIDAEVVKNSLKSLRKDAKWILLGFGYGLGPKTLYKKAIEAGLKVDQRICKQSFLAYWDLFSGIKQYAAALEDHVESNGWFQNQLGYRFVPTEKRKSFNGMIQSMVSSLFHWISNEIEQKCPYVQYVTTIHDENIYHVPKEKLETFRQDVALVVGKVNTELNWSVNLRLGFAPGENLFEAK